MIRIDRRLTLVAALAIALVGCGKAQGARGGSDDMTMGKANAPVTVTEYASLSCSHCARFNDEVFPKIKAKYIDTGQVRWVFREFLTPPVELAAAGALTARCAGPAKYFSVVDAIFHGQDEMFRTGDMRGVLLRVAKSAGLTEAQWDACVTDEKAITALNNRVESYAKTAKITATPTFFVGDIRKEGEMTLADFDTLVAQAKKK